MPGVNVAMATARPLSVPIDEHTISEVERVQD
jgi:hypothetical protein